MSAFDRVLDHARRMSRRIVLPEPLDERILVGAERAVREQLCTPVLLGIDGDIHETADRLNVDLHGMELREPAAEASQQRHVDSVMIKRARRGMSETQAQKALKNPLTVACSMVSAGTVDGCVVGATTSTAEVVRQAVRFVGKHPEAALVSSCFVMLTAPAHPVADVMVTADCALVIDPDASELADIAVNSGETMRQLLGLEPRVAMLSFSTAGSARHAHVRKVQLASELARARRPHWQIVGDVQLDAAVMPEVLQRKAPEQRMSEPCNVLIFPNLDAGNIGYKLIERFGGASAVGPILQGLDRPVNDLSRGCTADDVYALLAVTAAQANAEQTVSTATPTTVPYDQ